MKSRGGRFRERQHVMVAAVDAVHERDQFAATVREPEPNHVVIEAYARSTSEVNTSTCDMRRGRVACDSRP